MKAMRKALQAASVDGRLVEAIALDTTGSSVFLSAKTWSRSTTTISGATTAQGRGRPDHAHGASGKARGHPVVRRSLLFRVGFAKLLHWLRNNPGKRSRMVTALEHCDMVAAALCGIRDPGQFPRSICAMGHKWMWNASLGGLPPADFLARVDPLLKGVRGKARPGAMQHPMRWPDG